MAFSLPFFNIMKPFELAITVFCAPDWSWIRDPECDKATIELIPLKTIKHFYWALDICDVVNIIQNVSFNIYVSSKHTHVRSACVHTE